MGRLPLFALLLVLGAGAAHAQRFPFAPPPPLPYRPPIYVPPPPPLYVQPYVQPVNPYYWRKAMILRGIGIPLLSVGVPVAVAGGIVSIVGAACSSCSSDVSHAGIALLVVGGGLFVPGAILVGMGNYYRWMARFMARTDFGIAVARDHGSASLRVRF